MDSARAGHRPGVSGKARGLITRRSRVQITPPLPTGAKKTGNRSTSGALDVAGALRICGLSARDARREANRVRALARAVATRQVSLGRALRAVSR